MKSVVMIAHCFPPDCSAGTFRPLRFVRHLPLFGWQPTVITDKPTHYDNFDPGLLELVPKSTTVLRVPNPDPWKAFQDKRNGRFQQKAAAMNSETIQQIHAEQTRPLRSFVRGAVRNLEAFFYRPDMAMMWIGAATNAAVKACTDTGAKVVWATGLPWSSLVVARNVSLRTGLPYVLDLRDSWTLSYDELQERQSERAKARDRRLLGTLFHGAQAVVLRYQAEAECYWRVYRGTLDEKRIHLIPNGYEGEISSREIPRGDRCMVLYAGGIAPYIYETLLDALAQLKRTNPEVARLLRMVFVGYQTELIDTISNTLNLTDIVETSRALPFAEISKLQSQAHALLLLGWKPGPGCEFGGSKIFGYLKAGRPIVGVLPQDENTRMLRSVGVTTIAEADSITQISDVLKRLVDAWSTDKLSTLRPSREACEFYSAERQTQALVRALEGATPLDPFRPGLSSPVPSLEKRLDKLKIQSR